jgi:hypothetical protein
MSAGRYRRRAHECFQAAENVAGPGTKIWLLEMAQSWLMLAQQAEKNLAADPVHAAPRSHDEPVMQQQQQVQPEKDSGKENE